MRSLFECCRAFFCMRISALLTPVARIFCTSPRFKPAASPISSWLGPRPVRKFPGRVSARRRTNSTRTRDSSSVLLTPMRTQISMIGSSAAAKTSARSKRSLDWAKRWLPTREHLSFLTTRAARDYLYDIFQNTLSPHTLGTFLYSDPLLKIHYTKLVGLGDTLSGAVRYQSRQYKSI